MISKNPNNAALWTNSRFPPAPYALFVGVCHRQNNPPVWKHNSLLHCLVKCSVVRKLAYFTKLFQNMAKYTLQDPSQGMNQLTWCWVNTCCSLSAAHTLTHIHKWLRHTHSLRSHFIHTKTLKNSTHGNLSYVHRHCWFHKKAAH